MFKKCSYRLNFFLTFNADQFRITLGVHILMSRPTLRLHDGYSFQNWNYRPYVKQLQNFLNLHGYSMVLDGLFGPGTERTVKDFQYKKGLSADGLVGRRTWEKLMDVPSPDGLASNAGMVFTTTLPANSPHLRSQRRAAESYRIYIEGAARRFNFPVALICGIGSRESHWGLGLTPPGPGGTGDRASRRPKSSIGRTGNFPPDGGGFGRGIMQIDYDWHTFARGDDWKDAKKNIEYAIGKVLYPNYKSLRRRTNLSGRGLMSAAVSSYNSGLQAVYMAIKNGRTPDSTTTGRDYAKDVFNRAGWFYDQGWR